MVCVVSRDPSAIAGAQVTVALPDAPKILQSVADVITVSGVSPLLSVVQAIEYSRGFGDNVKKLFVWMGIQQMATILPVFAMLILRMPLAISPMYAVLLSTIMSFVPGLALMCEQPDIDAIIYRKTDEEKMNGNIRVFTKMRVIVFTYLVMGCIAASAGFCAFYTSMNQMGFPVYSMYGMLNA